MNSKIIFWFLKKTHGHSKPQVGTKIRKFPPCPAGCPAAMATELDEKLTIRGPIRKKYEKKQVCYC